MANSHSIDRKFTQKRHKMGKLTFKQMQNRRMENLGLRITQGEI